MKYRIYTENKDGKKEIVAKVKSYEWAEKISSSLNILGEGRCLVCKKGKEKKRGK